MSVKFAVLGLLKEQPDHGYRLKSRFEERVGRVWRLNLGQVYQTLHSLEKEGLIARIDHTGTSHEEDVVHPRRLYELTSKGRARLDHWSKRRSTVPRPVRDELLIQLLILAGDQPELALQAIDYQEQVYRTHQMKLLSRKRKIGAFKEPAMLTAHLGVEAALIQTDAHLRWLSYCRQKLLASQNPSGST